MKETEFKIEDCIKDAVKTIDTYIYQTTGIKAEQKEIANALTKYFVLKEILEFVLLERQESK